MIFMIKMLVEIVDQIKSNPLLYSLYYADACKELAGPFLASLRLWATQLLSKKCCSRGEPLATLCPISPARDFNLPLQRRTR